MPKNYWKIEYKKWTVNTQTKYSFFVSNEFVKFSNIFQNFETKKIINVNIESKKISNK